MTIVRYPSEFTATPNTDYIQIQSCRRIYNSGTSNTGVVSEYEQVEDPRGTSTLMLNMPQRIAETMQQSYRNASLGPEASNILSGKLSMADPGKLTEAVFRRLVENFVMDNASNALSTLGSSALSDNSILSATSGIIYNPMMEVLYDGPQFRTFNFQFSLLAKSQADAKKIFDIVRFFQWCSAPALNGAINTSKLTGALATGSVVQASQSAAQAIGQALTGDIAGAASTAAGGLSKTLAQGLGTVLAASGGAFTPPNRFITQPPLLMIRYKRGSDDHPYLLPLKPCVINNLDIQYTPSGNYTILNNFTEDDVATTVATTITVSLSEIKVVFQQDYEGQFQASI